MTAPRAWTVALVLLAAALLAGVAVGGVRLSFADLWQGAGPAGETARLVASLRIPRVLLAAVVGASLALAGAALQALLRNPLADPFLLGTSGGAATGAALAAIAGASPLLSPGAAFAGAAASSIAIATLARRGGRLDLQRLLLLGLVANAFFSAILLVPHAVRLAAGNRQRVLLPLSAVCGAALLVAADALGRTVIAPAELPIGAVTAAVGAPLFAWLLLRQP